MEKTAPASYPIHDLLSQRWSPRAFSDRPVESEKLLSLFEAARWAPSTSNEQPWAFLFATKDNSVEFERLASCLVEGNSWAKNASVLLLSVARKLFARTQKENRLALHDVGLADENLAIQAGALGLVVHPMAGFDLEKARTLFEIPPDCEPAAMMALGYPGDPAGLPEKLREREFAPRSRKPISEFVFTGRWGQSSQLPGS